MNYSRLDWGLDLSRFDAEGAKLVRGADALAERAHFGQVRDYTGEPYIEHPRRAALRLQLVRPDVSPETLAAVLGHDVLEDTTVTPAEFEAELGGVVLRRVQRVTKPREWKKLPRKELNWRYTLQLADGDAEEHDVKLVDTEDNLLGFDVARDPKRARTYLPAKALNVSVLTRGHPPLLRRVEALVHQRLQEMGALR